MLEQNGVSETAGWKQKQNGIIVRKLRKVKNKVLLASRRN
jgi:hypothetical protein